jgi:hypothetical protein
MKNVKITLTAIVIIAIIAAAGLGIVSLSGVNKPEHPKNQFTNKIFTFFT